MKQRSQGILPLLLFILYCTALCRIVLIREDAGSMFEQLVSPSLVAIHKGWMNANFFPFKTIYYYVSLQEYLQNGIQNVGGNILLFVPFALLLCMMRPGITARKTVAICFAVSLAIESLQLFFATGNFDVDDIILNVLGGLAGFIAWQILSHRPSGNLSQG